MTLAPDCPRAQQDLGKLVPCPQCGGRGYVTFRSTSKYGRIMIERVGCLTCWSMGNVYEGEAATWRAARIVASTGGALCYSTSGR